MRLGQFSAEHLLSFFRRLRLYVTPAIADSMHMDIYANTGPAIADRHHQVRRFPADSRQRDQFIDGIRDYSSIHVQQAAANGMNGFGFRPVEPDGINRLFDLPERKSQHRGRPMRQCEQPGAGFMCRLVFGSEAEETRNKDAKGVSVRLARHCADDRFLPLPDLTLDDSKRGSDLILAHGRGRGRKTFGEILQPTSQVPGRILTLAYASTTTFDAAAAPRAVWLSF